MNRKRIAFAVTCIAVTVGVICSLATYCIIKNANSDKMYISKEQYEIFMKLYDIEEVYSIIEDNYYGQIDEEKLLAGALKGMVEALGDPYSKYYTESEFIEFAEKYEGIYIGIGISVQKDVGTGYLVIEKVFKDTPAETAGLKTGDKITKINGESVEDLSLSEAIEKIRTSENSSALITILSGEEEKHYSIELKSVKKELVRHETFDGGIGYINLLEFTGNCTEEFKAALTELKDTNGLVIDLRDNPGGFVDNVQAIADMFLDECLITYSEDKDGNRTDIKATAGKLYDKPVVILVNGSSASASEMFSGAMQDNGRAKIVGTKTYGKGVIQSIIKIPSTGAGIKITSGSYYSPNGNKIQGVGIMPDYIVENADEQLNKAIELLLQ